MNDLRQRYRTLMEDAVLHAFSMPDPERRRIIAAVPALRNATVELTGTYGTGKTTLVNAVSRHFFVDADGPSLAIVRCYQELMDTDVLFHVDFHSGRVTPRAMLSARLRYINELPRSNPALQNALLSYFAERQVTFRDQHFNVPDGLNMVDRNPEDIGSEGVVEALHDRVDVEITLPVVDDWHRGALPAAPAAPLSPAEMQQIWAAVDAVDLPAESWEYAGMLNRYFSACHKNRSEANRLFELPCEGCAYQAEICRSLRATPGLRGLIALQALAKALAWYAGRSSVGTADLELALPYVYSHRLAFHHEVYTQWPNPQIYLREFLVGEQLAVKRERWLEAIAAKLAGDLTRLEELAQLSQDLVIAWLYHRALAKAQPVTCAA